MTTSKTTKNQLIFEEYPESPTGKPFIKITDNYKNNIGVIFRNKDENGKVIDYNAIESDKTPIARHLWPQPVKDVIIEKRDYLLEKAYKKRLELKAKKEQEKEEQPEQEQVDEKEKATAEKEDNSEKDKTKAKRKEELEEITNSKAPAKEKDKAGEKELEDAPL